MARQRIVFISGLGNFVPGQVSNLKDATGFVQGAGTIASSNPATSSQSGTLVNPAVGAATAAIASSGLLKSGLGSLGIPQNIQNLISASINTGGLFVELYLNPQRIHEEHDKAQTEMPTAAGYGTLHWGNKLAKLKFDMITRSLRPGSSQESKDRATKAQQNLDQFKKFYQTNNFNIGLIYQSQIFIGKFEGPLTSDRDKDNPNIITWSFTFKIDKLPQVSLPGFGVFDVNKLPFTL